MLREGVWYNQAVDPAVQGLRGTRETWVERPRHGSPSRGGWWVGSHPDSARTSLVASLAKGTEEHMSTFGTILVIDDGTRRGEVLTLWLEGRGFACALVKTGAKAASLLRREKFDAVLLVDEVWFPPHLRKVLEGGSGVQPSGPAD